MMMMMLYVVAFAFAFVRYICFYAVFRKWSLISTISQGQRWEMSVRHGARHFARFSRFYIYISYFKIPTSFLNWFPSFSHIAKIAWINFNTIFALGSGVAYYMAIFGVLMLDLLRETYHRRLILSIFTRTQCTEGNSVSEYECDEKRHLIKKRRDISFFCRALFFWQNQVFDGEFVLLFMLCTVCV